MEGLSAFLLGLRLVPDQEKQNILWTLLKQESKP